MKKLMIVLATISFSYSVAADKTVKAVTLSCTPSLGGKQLKSPGQLSDVLIIQTSGNTISHKMFIIYTVNAPSGELVDLVDAVYDAVKAEAGSVVEYSSSEYNAALTYSTDITNQNGAYDATFELAGKKHHMECTP